MKRYSDAWHEAVTKGRFREDAASPLGPTLPTMPWVPHPLSSVLVRECLGHGKVVDMRAGEWPGRMGQAAFVYVEKGLAGRICGIMNGGSSGTLVPCPPGRLLAGGINWLTRRPAIGRCGALSECTVRVLPHEAWPKEPGLVRTLSLQMELNWLSERMGFTIASSLAALQRFKALLLTWIVYFGRLEPSGEGLRVVMPVPGRLASVRRAVGVSQVTMEKLVSELARQGDYRHESADFTSIRVGCLQDIHEWMALIEGEGTPYARPKRVEDFLLAVDGGLYD